MLESKAQQRSPEWFDIRRGKFTSSCASKLMGIKGLGDTGKTYAFELAVEIVEGKDLDDDFVNFDMQRGVDTEPIAFEKFEEVIEPDFLTVRKNGFFYINPNTGGSPDGIVSDNSVLEIKCPKPNKFFRLVCDDVIDSCYIDQMQHQMWMTGSEKAYFFNFLIYNGEPLWHKIIVPRDDSRIELMKSRIEEAVVIRDKFVEQLIEKRQWVTLEF